MSKIKEREAFEVAWNYFRDENIPKIVDGGTMELMKIVTGLMCLAADCDVRREVKEYVQELQSILKYACL